jgi:hypothetical protein
MRMRATCSITRAPILIRRSRIVANSAPASGRVQGIAARGVHQPECSSVENEPRRSADDELRRAEGQQLGPVYTPQVPTRGQLETSAFRLFQVLATLTNGLAGCSGA